jgi:hypothetical protein
MANTLIPIQTYTLTGSAATVTFSNIPQNYTDLKVVTSVRSDTGSFQSIRMTVNGATTNYSNRRLYGEGAGAYSDASTPSWLIQTAVSSTSETASTFGNAEFYIPNYASSNYKSVSVDSVSETNATTAYAFLSAGLWSQTTAISSIGFSMSSGNFVSGSTFTLYGISNGVKATGGTVTVAGGYAYHTFTSTGSFLPNQQIKGAETLVIAGGGAAKWGGGGGAGGLLYTAGQTLNAGNSYTALIGAGGSAISDSSCTKGADSVFGSSTAVGGGKGGGYIEAGGPGGSSGGSGWYVGTPGTATAGQGNVGAGSPNNGYFTSGGGGGAGTAGTLGGTDGGAGGDGSSTYSSWHAITGTGVISGGVYYIAGGGGGGADTPSGHTTAGAGGKGGGAAGSASSPGSAATANTGGGGGGSGRVGGTTQTGTAGGSGLIIVRYPLS